MIRRPHWLPRNDRSWSPHRVIVIDAEGETAKVPTGELDTFRLACASFTIRDGDRDAAGRTEEITCHDPAELWRWVSTRAHHGHSTWLVAHGLHYDYTVTAAHRVLEELGWERVDWSTSAGARWVRWRRGRRTLLMVDLFNYLPMPLAEIGKAIDLPKLGMPAQAARPRTWERYCRRDVAIAREAFLHLLEWWDRADLGRWGLTSASLAWAAFRHRFLRERTITLHDDDRARILEREALFGGRREIYRKGRLPDGLWVDLDYVSHYLMTAGVVNVPTRLLERWEGFEPYCWRERDPHLGLIARVEVEVSSPVAPYRHPALGVIYPVGRFVTTLAGPELELVEQHGRIVRWIEGALYKLEPALESWADWLLPQVTGPRPEADRLTRTILKGWTRSLIGKFGQRAAPDRTPSNTGRRDELPEITLVVGAGVEELPWREQPPPDPTRGKDATLAFPAITAWVHAAARAELWRGMTTAGLEDLAYADTDGFLVRAHAGNLERLARLNPRIDLGAASPAAAIPEPKVAQRRPTVVDRRRARSPEIPEIPAELPTPGTMAVKGRFAGVEIHRPQDYVLDDREVIKGLPKARVKTGDREWLAEFWPGIPWQLANGRPGTYLRPIRTVHLGDEYLRGWVLDDGRVVPLEVTWGRRGLEVLPFARTRHHKAGRRLQDREQGRRVATVARGPTP